jgi:uncharacterized protein (DUF1697 family)
MDELKQLFALPGIKNISTYIQSGNVLFDSTKDEATLKKSIETALKKALNYEVTVFLKTVPQLEDVIARCPFTEDDQVKIYISLLSGTPEKQGIPQLEALKAEGEDLAVSGSAVYILCPAHTYGNSKLSNVTVEKKLKVQATTRNWNTMNKLVALAKK